MFKWIGVNKLKRKKIKIEPRSDLALSCTVVFRGGSSYGLSGTTTCRCVLPFDSMAAKILLTQGKGIQHFEDPMDVVRKGRRDDLMESVISHLRLCMLGEGKFVKACSLKDVRSGSNEVSKPVGTSITQVWMKLEFFFKNEIANNFFCLLSLYFNTVTIII